MTALPAASSRVVVLAGGRGTRLRPYTTILPKPLLPIADMPILEILIRQLARDGFSRISVASGYLAGLLQAYFGDGSRWGISIDYTIEDDPLGTAGPLALVRDLTEPFVVTNGDVLSNLSYRDFLSFHCSTDAIATVAACRREVQISLGTLELDGEDNLVGYTEKPTLTYVASMGIYAMQPEILEHIPVGEHYDLPDLVRKLIERGERVAAFPFDGYWRDLGQLHDYEEATEEFPSVREEILGPRGRADE